MQKSGSSPACLTFHWSLEGSMSLTEELNWFSWIVSTCYPTVLYTHPHICKQPLTLCPALSSFFLSVCHRPAHEEETFVLCLSCGRPPTPSPTRRAAVFPLKCTAVEYTTQRHANVLGNTEGLMAEGHVYDTVPPTHKHQHNRRPAVLASNPRLQLRRS